MNAATLRPWLLVIGTMALGVPAIAIRIISPDLPVLGETAIFGLGILAAAFLLGGAAEVAQRDIPPALSLAVLAFVAVLPEYAVDLLFAWRAGTDPEQAQFAIANMTGANRLLIGVGWAFVLFLFAFKTGGLRALFRGLTDWAPQRGGGRRPSAGTLLHLPHTISLEITVLAVATLYSFLIPLKGNISLIDTVVLASLFGFYLFRLFRHPREEPEIGGPAAFIARLPKWRRRATVCFLFAFAAGAIVASAEPFADGLIETGTEFGVDEFLLVQWVAPFASESPEFLAALYLVWRGMASAGMAVLISSKVNQWTLLIASLPIAFSISGSTFSGLPIDGRQQQEVFLTAAQSLFAVLLILDKRLSPKAAVVLLGLFLGQFLVIDSTVRWGFSFAYLALAAFLFAGRFRDIPGVVREAFTEPAESETHRS